MPKIKTYRRVQFGSPKLWFWVAGVLLFAATVMAVLTTRFVIRSVVTTGTVAAMNDMGSSDSGQTMYAPEFKFIASNGKSYDIVSHTGSNPPAYVVGQSVKIRYVESDPSGARIDAFGQMWLSATLPGGFGLLLGAVAFCMRSIQSRKAAQAVPVTQY